MKVYKYARKLKKGKIYYLKWQDASGTWHRESTGCSRATAAERIRADRELELTQTNQLASCGWEAFTSRYLKTVLGGTSRANKNKFKTAANSFASICDPGLISDVDTDMVSRFILALRGEDKSEATILGYLSYLERAFEWAAKPQIGLLKLPPVIVKPDLPSDPARGRPLTLEEFERIKMQAARVVGRKSAQSFQNLMDGLMMTGFRLAELMNIWWKRERSDQIVVVESPASVRLEIPARSQKRRKYQLWRAPEEFEAWVRKTHPENRVGRVFPALKKSGEPHTRPDTVGKRISLMGEFAGVVVEYDDLGPIKYASAKDIRATFGQRLMRQKASVREVQTKMRHSSITTTIRHYATMAPDEYDEMESSGN